MYIVGNGPHVIQTINVYFSEKNWNRLQKYIELYMNELENTNMIRERRSSRAARTRMERASLQNFGTLKKFLGMLDKHSKPC
jgi:hypothetical protein